MRKRKKRVPYIGMSKQKKNNIFKCLQKMKVVEIQKKYNITAETVNKIVKEMVRL